MYWKRYALILFLFLVGTPLPAQDLERRLSEPSAPMTDEDKAMIGRLVCGPEGFELSEDGVRCPICPSFTGRAGFPEGLTIGHIIRGRFTGHRSADEMILDTEGCEAHYASFGGMILLSSHVARRISKIVASADRSNPRTLPDSAGSKLVYYKPGFRLNDCLVFGKADERSLLVCNEVDMAQGEIIGHISAMEISKRRVTRWRLMRWYDNFGTDGENVISVVPSRMLRVPVDDDEEYTLKVKLKVIQASRDDYEKGVNPGRTLELDFQRKGRRFFPTRTTRQLLGEINAITSSALE